MSFCELISLPSRKHQFTRPIPLLTPFPCPRDRVLQPTLTSREQVEEPPLAFAYYY